MKKIGLLCWLALAGYFGARAQDVTGLEYRVWNQMSIGKQAATPATDPSAWLEIGVEYTSKGFLIPRTDSFRILSPRRGNLIYQQSNAAPYIYNGSWWDRLVTANQDRGVKQIQYSALTGVFKLYRNGDTVAIPPITINMGTNLAYAASVYDSANSRIIYTKLGGGHDTLVLHIGGGGTGDTSQAAFDRHFAAKTTDNLPEGVTNLYFTVPRVRSALASGNATTYSSTPGSFSVGGNLTGDVNLSGVNTYNWKMVNFDSILLSAQVVHFNLVNNGSLDSVLQLDVHGNLKQTLKGSGGASAFSGLTDVSVISPTNGQWLHYVTSTSKWTNFTPGSGDITGPLGYVPTNPNGTSLQYTAGDGSFRTFPTNVSSFTNDANYLTATVAVGSGGSGRTSFPTYGLVFGGSTGTGPLQGLSSLGSVNQLLMSGGPGVLPAWGTPTALIVEGWLGGTPVFTETDPIASAKTVNLTAVANGGVKVNGTASQALSGNPSWTVQADSVLMSTTARLQKSLDSINLIFLRKSDTASLISSRAYRQKLADSLAALINLKVNVVDSNWLWASRWYRQKGDDSVAAALRVALVDSMAAIRALSFQLYLDSLGTTGIAPITKINDSTFGVRLINDSAATGLHILPHADGSLTFYSDSSTHYFKPPLYAFNDSTAAIDLSAAFNADSLNHIPLSHASPTAGQVPTYNGSAWVPTTPSSGGASVANPTGLIGMTVVNGSATTAGRSDGTHAIDPAITPTWTGSHTFSAGSLYGADLLLNSNGTINFGSGTNNALKTYTHGVQSNGGMIIDWQTGQILRMQINARDQFSIQSTGEIIDSAYIGNVFAGSATADTAMTLNNGHVRKVPLALIGGGSTFTRQSITSGTSATGTTITSGKLIVTFDFTSTISAFAFTMPGSPFDGEVVQFKSGGALSYPAYEVNTMSVVTGTGGFGQTVPVTTLQANESAEWVWDNALSLWMRSY